MTIIARCINNKDATTIASLVLLPPLRCCLACIPRVVMSLATFPCLRPLSLLQSFLALLSEGITSVLSTLGFLILVYI